MVCTRKGGDIYYEFISVPDVFYILSMMYYTFGCGTRREWHLFQDFFLRFIFHDSYLMRAAEVNKFKNM